jgi:hypothetical protein
LMLLPALGGTPTRGLLLLRAQVSRRGDGGVVGGGEIGEPAEEILDELGRRRVIEQSTGQRRPPGSGQKSLFFCQRTARSLWLMCSTTQAREDGVELPWSTLPR